MIQNKLIIRPGTSDEGTWHDVFDEDKAYHRPPPSVRNPKTILDLGAYIGYTAIDLAILFPDAIVFACEPCWDNYLVMKSNITISGRENVFPMWGGVGEADGIGTVVGSAYNAMKLQPGYGDVTVFSMEGLTKGGVDYIKMDIEGMEKNLLESGSSWAGNVQCIKVELHDDYTVPEALADLSQLGFLASVYTNHPACVIGIR